LCLFAFSILNHQPLNRPCKKVEGIDYLTHTKKVYKQVLRNNVQGRGIKDRVTGIMIQKTDKDIGPKKMLRERTTCSPFPTFLVGL
jgi:hypothetical protein